jgi:hypothetical protein
MSESQEVGKGRPTPPRKQREAERKKPLVGDRSKEAKRAAREKMRLEREKIRNGMMAGDERYLTSRDRGPQRRMVRDLVDTRFTAGELVLPSLFFVVLLTFVNSVAIQFYALIAMWTLFGLVAIDSTFIGRRARKAVAEKFGAENVEKGIAWYAAMRAIQMRSLRIPKPQVKRFQKLDKENG